MFLEHLASYNGADMHKYNTLYTHRLAQHVFAPESNVTLLIIPISPHRWILCTPAKG